MDVTVSLAVYFLLKMSNMAKQQADNRRTNDWGWKVAAVGLKTIKQPIKPAKLASQRCLPTFSPRMSCAKSILKKGIVLLMTTQEAKGMRFSPKHHSPMPRARRRPRAACIESLADLKALRPWNRRTGRSTKAAAENRKKTIWKGGRFSPKNFMMLSFPMLTTKCMRYQPIPVKYTCDADIDAAEAPAAKAGLSRPSLTRCFGKPEPANSLLLSLAGAEKHTPPAKRSATVVTVSSTSVPTRQRAMLHRSQN
mmetsp:Transcript_16540/g.36565  ORF Transcript_16540/g.36565 Transcript_16540/m.36565 type:complete len:252 (+) Transcript_16540:467-1222(+)